MGISHELGIMDRHRGIGSHFARRRSQEQVTASRVAHRLTRHDFSLNFAASGLDLRQASSICAPAPQAATTVRPTGQQPSGCATSGQSRRPVPPNHPRMEIDRALRVLHILQETANARGGIPIDIAFDGNPAVHNRARMNLPDPLPDR